jgi:hypothetical protein
MSDVEKYNVNALIYTNVILSFFSLIGSSTIIILFFCRKNLRSLVFTLVFYLAISELLNSIANIMSINKLVPPENNLVCEIQSVILNYTDICTLIWMCIISYTIFNMMTNLNLDFAGKKTIFLILGFLLPVLFNTYQAIIFFQGQDGREKPEPEIIPDCWCWIIDMSSNKTTVIIIYSFYWLLIFSNFILIFRVISYLKSNCDYEDPNSRKIRKMINKLYLYPILSGVCFLFATIHRAYQLYYIRNDDYVKTPGDYRWEIIFYLFHGIFNSIRGFIFFIIYGCNSKVLKEMRGMLRLCA